MINGYVLGAVAAVSLVLAWRWRRHVATWKAEDFLAAALFPLVLASALLLFIKTPFREAASEIPSVFTYAPSKLLHTPKASTLAAGFMAGACLFATLLWAHARSGAYRPPYVILGALLCYLALFNLSGTATLATTIHAHAPTVGCGLLACVALFRRGEEGPPETIALLFSTLFTSLSVLSAPAAAPLPLALAVHLGFAWGRKTCGRYLLLLAGIGGALALTLFLLGGPIGRPPWRTDLGPSARTFVEQGWQVLVLLPVAVVLRARHAALESGRLRREAATLPLLAGLFLVPTALMESAAGRAGATCFPLFYLVASLSLMLTTSGGSGGDEFSRRWARGLLVGLAGGILFFASGQVREAWSTPAAF